MLKKITRRLTAARAFVGSIIFLGLILALQGSVCYAARIAGDEGVTSVSPEPQEPAKKVTPPYPSGTKPRPPVHRAQPAENTASEKPNKEKKAAQAKQTKAPENNPQKQAAAKPQETKKENNPDSRYVTIDFDNVDITLFIKFISELTGKNFIIDKTVRGNVTIISPTKISVDEAYKVFESVLEVHGFTTVPSGSVTKIVRSVEARSKSIRTRLREESFSSQDRVVTQVVPLNYANPDELSKLFRPLISKNSIIVSYDPTRTLIVTDVESNIKRLLDIVKVIDVAGVGEEVSVIPITHATASMLATSLNDIFQTQVRRTARKIPAQPITRIVADERTNSLITLATEDDTQKIKGLVALLDKPIPRGEGDIHVYYLHNANAEDLQKVLMAIPSKETKAETKGKAPVVSEEVQIVADKATNSLVITAKKNDYLVLEDIITKLDIPRSMVYLEALIMEVNVDKEFQLGVEWLGMEDFTYDDKEGGFFAGSGGVSDYANIQGLSGTPPRLPSGFSVGVFGEAITIGDLVFPNLGAILQAYQKDSDINIISTPQILTTDNEEAEIYVGENVPYLTKEATGEQIYQTYEYRDVGVTLKITPQINQERFVRLEIFQENISLKKGTEIFRPTTLKRSAETTVIIQDKNTVVIGGIIGESAEKTTSKTPCLGDIPGLRWLFSALSKSENKTNLFVFITPYIIENSQEAKEVYEKKKGNIEGVRGGAVKLYKKPGQKDAKERR
ncbi:MAG: type II secretion system secretin GspD [Thermodesulfobacteriota bacterium]